jgi:hypothetical protein
MHESPNIVTEVKSRDLRTAGRVSWMKEINTCRMVEVKSLGKWPTESKKDWGLILKWISEI